ncbi:MAG: YbaB/EbfC family nucleoid-associated protein [Thermoanaerobacteraceae bacterium]|nr:YbaB/EbfC family nucleoid-associated protein [Thermoanaerobacteraceae bacterium]
MLKQVQKLQGEMARLQEELGERTTEATAGGGVVRVVVNGRQEVVRLEIKPEAVDPEDVEMLQDVIIAAVNEALRQSREMVAREMGRLTGGLGIPGLV